MAAAVDLPTVKGYAVVPLKNVGNAFSVDVEVNGKPMHLLLDTGAPLTVLLEEKAAAAGVVGAMARGAREIRSLRCGGAELRGVNALSMSFSGANAARARNHWAKAGRDGLLGLDTLREWGAVVDMAAMRLFLRTDPKVDGNLREKLHASGWTEVAMEERRGHINVPAAVGGRRGSMTVDTGATFTTLQRDFAVKAGLQLGGHDLRGGTIGKLDVRSDATEVPDLVIGTYHAGPFPVALTNLDYAIGQSWESDGLLGFEFLRLNAAVIDCKNSRLYLRHTK
jgi:predicted aspartyl protease